MTQDKSSRLKEWMPFILVATLLALFLFSVDVLAEAAVNAPTQVPVATPAAPPQWAQDLIVSAEALPIIGPVVAKALLYLGIVTSVLTLTVGFLLTVIATIMGGANVTGLTGVATALATFRDGKIMYWLKYFSLFNAKKPQ